MLLNGFGFSGYRSFGNELALIAPLKKINFIIGQNNSGKSNIIRFLYEQFPNIKAAILKEEIFSDAILKKYYKEIDYSVHDDITPQIAWQVSYTDLNKFIESNEKIFFSLKSTKKVLKPLIISGKSEDEQKKDKLDYTECVESYKKNCHLAEQLFNKLVVEDNEGNTFIVYKKVGDEQLAKLFMNDISNEDDKKINSEDIDFFMENLFDNSRFPRPLSLDKIMSRLLCKAYKEKLINFFFIPDIRKVEKPKGKGLIVDKNFSGLNLIESMVKIQNPHYKVYSTEKAKFKNINNFIQTVLEKPNAYIEIPYSRDMILVHMDGKTLPLESLGTGIHEVIIIAVAATLTDNGVLCIEEPELHMHPVLQRKLIRYLGEHTSNQYLLTTHSVHLLDAVDDASIFHVTLKEGQSYVEAITTNRQKIDICKNLGYKASDLLQANCIIWVEGPSDRIYINYWIRGKCREKCADLIEGIHYTIMFYGGRLARHLTGCFQDEQVVESTINEFINLRSLNTHAVIVMDSDKVSSRAKINSTKQRLYKEFNQDSGFAWITKGREIENYLGDDKVEACVLKAHPKSAEALENNGDYSNLLIYKPKGKVKNKKGKSETKEKPPTADKVAVAKIYVENYQYVDYSKLDLEEKVNQLVGFIFECNDKK